jgi:putative MATE family efflux protein
VLTVLLRGHAGIRLTLRPLCFDRDLIRRILRVGVPTGLEQVLFRSGNMVFARILASLGTVAYAANQVAINGWSLAFMPGFGFAVAATTLVGQGLGAGDPDLAESRGYLSYRLGAAVMVAIGLTFLFFPAQIIGFFTTDPEVVALGAGPLRLAGVVQPLSAASMVFSGALRGAGDTRGPMVVTGLGIWLVRLPLALLLALALHWGLLGAWLAMTVDISGRGVFNWLRFRSGRWKTMRV